MTAARRRAAVPRSPGEHRTRPKSIQDQASELRTSHCPRHRRASPFPLASAPDRSCGSLVFPRESDGPWSWRSAAIRHTRTAVSAAASNPAATARPPCPQSGSHGFASPAGRPALSRPESTRNDTVSEGCRVAKSHRTFLGTNNETTSH